MEFRTIQHGSEDYRRECELRQEVLRAPLGMNLYDEDLSAEKDQLHFGLFDSDGTLLACVIGHVLSPAKVKIRQMAVRTTHQKQGLGRAILHRAETSLAERGYVEFALHARMTALGFYEKLGYVAAGRPFTEVGLPHVLMVKRLTS